MDIYTSNLDRNNPGTYVKKILGAADTHGVKDMRNTSRARRIVGAVASCYALALWVAPAAHAGELIDTTTEVAGVVGGGAAAVVETVTKPVSDSSNNDGGGSLSGTVGQVTETVSGTTQVVTETVEETVNTVTDTLDKTTGGTTKPVSDATKETVKTVGQYGDSVGNRAADTVDSVGGVLKGKGDRTGQRNQDARDGSSRTGSRGDATNVLGNRAEQGAATGSARERVTLTSDGTSAVATPADESIVQQIGRVAAEAAKQMAFPLALTLLVGAFLTMQNRMDRKDPKLALAPVDSEHDLLTFS